MKAENLSEFMNAELFYDGHNHLNEKEFAQYCVKAGTEIDFGHKVKFNSVEVSQEQFRLLCAYPVEELSPRGYRNFLAAMSIYNPQVFGDKCEYAQSSHFKNSQLGKMDSASLQAFMQKDWNGCDEVKAEFFNACASDEQSPSDARTYLIEKDGEGNLVKAKRKIKFWNYRLTPEQFNYLKNIKVEVLERHGIATLLGALSIYEPKLFADKQILANYNGFCDSGLGQKALVYRKQREIALERHKMRMGE